MSVTPGYTCTTAQLWDAVSAKERERFGHMMAICAAMIELVGFVFMPEHVHLLVYCLSNSETGDMEDYLRRIKESFSKKIKKLLKENKSPLLERLTVQERPGKYCFRFWQEGPGFDRNLYTPKALLASLDYLHNNPVERKLCQRAIDWKWHEL